MERVTLFVDVLLPVPVPRNYTYRVPYHWNEQVKIGQRVIVQFGSKKILTGIIITVHQQPPAKHQAKSLLNILDDQPVINGQQLSLFNWMASYYMCAQGQVLQVALPSGLKLTSQSKIQIHPEYRKEESPYPFDDDEMILLQALKRDGALEYAEASEILGSNNLHKIIKSLLAKNAIMLFEEVKDKYQPKKENRIRLSKANILKNALERQFELLSKKPKQTEVLLKYLQEVPVFKQPELNQKGIGKAKLLSGMVSPSSLKTLIKNGVMEEFEIIVSRFQTSDQDNPESNPILSSEQTKARNAILDSFDANSTVLFHGITGSGKTEIYVDIIKQVLDSGSQVLYLLPEIALTTQIVSRLKKIFGSSMGIYHSRFSDNERVEVWRGVLDGTYSFIVGVRSAVFLPFNNLGLIIVDEEHELSFKQFDPAPRYHARDVGLVLAKIHHSKTLLGSATPSVESFYHAQQGKYSLVSLDERYRKAALPKYELIDTRKAQLKKQMKGVFTSELLRSLENILNIGKQAIIFQNRRGYAPYLQCQTCGHIPQCQNCAVTLTFHLHYNQLRCHYCGYKEKMTDVCSHCESRDLSLVGFGTEKIEEELKQIFPESRIQRMDLDTTRRKYSYQHIIDLFEAGGIDILIGTQMVSKGLDFDNVDFVGVLDMDRAMHFPDFRSHERVFQLITQVGGRAGRKSGKGLVLVQTANVDHRLLSFISDHNYLAFYQHEIQERSKYQYPPFARLIRLTVKSPDAKLCHRAAKELAGRLIVGLGKSRVLGPEEPIVSKVRNQYLMELFIKLEKGTSSLGQVKQKLAGTMGELGSSKEFRSVRIVPDVDPY